MATTMQTRPGAHVLISNVLYGQHKWFEMEKEDRAAIAIDRNIAAAHLNLGAALLNEDKLDEAFEETRLTIWLNSPSPAGLLQSRSYSSDSG